MLHWLKHMTDHLLFISLPSPPKTSFITMNFTIIWNSSSFIRNCLPLHRPKSSNHAIKCKILLKKNKNQIFRVFPEFSEFSTIFCFFHLKRHSRTSTNKISYKYSIFDFTNFPTFPNSFHQIFFRINLLLTITNNWKKIWAKSAQLFSIDELLYIFHTTKYMGKLIFFIIFFFGKFCRIFLSILLFWAETNPNWCESSKSVQAFLSYKRSN